MPIALALSPHLDDAAFSCGGTLARLAASGWRVVVATLFTRSMPAPQGFALECQRDKGLDDDIDYMALRRSEDAQACTLLGSEAHWLDFAEAPHRGYHSAAALFGPVLAADRVADDLVPAIHSLVETLRPDLIFAPQAIGGHVDHVVAAQALRRLDLATPILWWRDYPYVARTGTASPLSDALAGEPEHTVIVSPEPRLAACSAYASQLGFQFGGRDRLDAALTEAGLVERFLGHGLPACLSS